MKKELPKIMYDQSQYTALYYIDLEGFWLSARAVDKMETISGYKPDYWILYTQNKPESCWFGAYSPKTLRKEAEIGFRNFTDKDFVKKFETLVNQGLTESRKVKNIFFNEIKDNIPNLIKDNPQKLIEFLTSIKNLNEDLIANYMLSQPQRFDLFSEENKEFEEDENLNLISTNAYRMTLVSNLEYKLLSFVEKVKNSSEDLETMINKNQEEFDELKKYSDEYGFLEWNIFGGEYLDSNNLKSRINNLLEKNDFEKDLNQLRKLKESIEDKNSLILKNESDEKYQIANIMGNSGLYRFDLQTYSLCLMNYVEVIVKELAKEFSLKENEVKSYLANDIFELIKNGSKVDGKVIEKRQKGFLIIHHTTGHDNFIADGAHEQIRDLLQHRKDEIEKTKELKGNVASWPDKDQENIVGEAFVLTTAFDIQDKITQFREGQILVATQTHPHVVPIMKKAKAIITDEGGVTCHAAIVSRELGKPCVIGTRLSTKIFKNGDMIKVSKDGSVVKNI